MGSGKGSGEPIVQQRRVLYFLLRYCLHLLPLHRAWWVRGNRRKCALRRGVPDQEVLSASHQKTSFSQEKILYIAHSNAVHPSLHSLGEAQIDAVDFTVLAVAI